MDAPALAGLAAELRERTPLDAAALLGRQPPAIISDALALLSPGHALAIAGFLPGTASSEEADTAALSAEVRGTVAELMEPAPAVLRIDQTVSAAVDYLVQHGSPRDISYFYLVDAQQRLLGVVGMRDLLLARPAQALAEIMVKKPFAFRPYTPLREATRAALKRRLPRYPVVDDEGILTGFVRGWKLFERFAAEVGNQVGSMVGLDRAERINTPLLQAFRMRHPWLQLNLLTAFAAAFVVGMFEDTIARIVALAVFLPVLAGQSGNTGCQALAITLRGMTLGETAGYPMARLMGKEVLLGALNGALVGLVAATAMGIYAASTGTAQPMLLALVVLMAMVGACVASGLCGVLVPFTLRALGADPAMASTIFLTTITDILGMGLMLYLATTLML